MVWTASFDNDPIANPTFTTTYYLQISDFYGCVSFVDSVVVAVLEHPIVDAGPDVSICPDSATGEYLTATVLNPLGAPGPYSYEWIPADGLLGGNTTPTVYARPDSTTIYYAIVTSTANGCTSLPTTLDTTSSVTVTVHPKPRAEAGPDTGLCYLDTMMFNGIGYDAGPDYAYEWSPNLGLSDPNVSNPMASPPLTTNYILSVWSNGCQGTDTMTVTVHPLPYWKRWK